jgi:hypothetical protein
MWGDTGHVRKREKEREALYTRQTTCRFFIYRYVDGEGGGSGVARRW